MSFIFISLNFSTPIPHSKPVLTSFTSSLNLFSEDTLPSYINLPSLITRILSLFDSFPLNT